MHSNKQMIHWVPGTGLLSLKKLTKKYEFMILNWPYHPGKEMATLPHNVLIRLDAWSVYVCC